MIKFVGEHTVKVDDKGRIILPAPFKSLISSEHGELRFVVKKDIFFNCLEMFTYDEWIRQSEEVKSKLNFFNKEHAIFWREYMRNRALVEPDEKFGRLSVPKKLLEGIGVDREVVFAGSDHKIEIWSKEAFLKAQISEDRYSDLAEKILG